MYMRVSFQDCYRVDPGNDKDKAALRSIHHCVSAVLHSLHRLEMTTEMTEKTFIQVAKVPQTASTLAYSDSTPGSIKEACPRIKIADEPTSQKKTDTGEENHSMGMPITNKPVYNDFCVITWPANCKGSVAASQRSHLTLTKLVDRCESTRQEPQSDQEERVGQSGIDKGFHHGHQTEKIVRTYRAYTARTAITSK
jgi:hypothetical protein